MKTRVLILHPIMNMNKIQTKRPFWTKDYTGENQQPSDDYSSEEWSDDEWMNEEKTTKSCDSDSNSELDSDKQALAFYEENYGASAIAAAAAMGQNTGSDYSDSSESEPESEPEPERVITKGNMEWRPDVDKYATFTQSGRLCIMYAHPEGSQYKSLLIVVFKSSDVGVMTSDICKQFEFTFPTVVRHHDPYTGYTGSNQNEDNILPEEEAEIKSEEEDSDEDSDEDSEEEDSDEEVVVDPIGNRTRKVIKVSKANTSKRILNDKGKFYLSNFYEKEGATLQDLRKHATRVISLVHAAEMVRINAAIDRKKNAFERRKDRYRVALAEKENARTKAYRTKNWDEYNRCRETADALYMPLDAQYTSSKSIKNHGGHRDKNNKRTLQPRQQKYELMVVDI